MASAISNRARDLLYFMDCIEHKYVNIDECSEVSGVEIVVNKKIPLTQVRVVSFFEYRNLKFADREGTSNDIEGHTPNIEELDLSKTKIEDWGVILNICRQLKRLRELTINRLKFQNESLATDQVYEKIERLSVCKMLVTPENYIAMANTFPALQTLIMKHSKLTNVSFLPESRFNCVKRLDLSMNEFNHWEQLLPVSKLEHLTVLNLSSNPLVNIAKLDIPEGAPFFPSLKTLNIEEVNVDNWTSIANLNQLPVLEDLRFTKTPLAIAYGEDARKFVIAIVGNLEVINGGKVDYNERRSGERAFVREFRDADDCTKVQTVDQSKLSEKAYYASMSEEDHDTVAEYYAKNFAKVGEVFHFAEVDLAPPTDILLHIEAFDGRSETHRLGVDLTVQQLKEICESLFGIPIKDQRIFHTDPEIMHVSRRELRDDNRQLFAYRMRDNDIIHIQSRGPDQFYKF